MGKLLGTGRKIEKKKKILVEENPKLQQKGLNENISSEGGKNWPVLGLTHLWFQKKMNFSCRVDMKGL